MRSCGTLGGMSVNCDWPIDRSCLPQPPEDPEARDEHNARLQEAVDTAVQMNLDGDIGIPVPDYTEENVSTKVVKIIQSYTGVVNKMVWRKY